MAVMKFAAALAFCLALPLAASDRGAERRLVAEILELIDVRALAASTVDRHLGEASDDTRTFRTLVLARLDYAKLADKVYAPIFLETFTEEELRQLLAFYRTPAGRKSAAILPQLADSFVKASSVLYEEFHDVREEMEREELQKRPDLAAMRDLRIIATSLEARATDENEYPQVPFEKLAPLLEPVYVKTLPRVDPWGTPYAYVTDGRNYRVASAGADKSFDWASRQLDLTEAEPSHTENPDADIVFQNGNFRQFPARVAKEMQKQQ